MVLRRAGENTAILAVRPALLCKGLGSPGAEMGPQAIDPMGPQEVSLRWRLLCSALSFFLSLLLSSQLFLFFFRENIAVICFYICSVLFYLRFMCLY